MPSTDFTVYAKYKPESSSKLPILTEGKIMPQILYCFEKRCQRYFSVKGITRDADQVLWTISGIRHPAISAWIHSNNTQLITLSFADFMKEVRKHALDTDWECDIRREMTQSQYSLSVDFQNWANNIIFLNCILKNTESDKHFDEMGLLDLLKVNLSCDLYEEVRAPNSQVRTDSLKNWVQDVRRLAEAERRHVKRTRELVEDARQRLIKRQAAAPISASKPRPFANTTNPVPTSDRVSPLTADERALLNKRKGRL